MNKKLLTLTLVTGALVFSGCSRTSLVMKPMEATCQKNAKFGESCNIGEYGINMEKDVYLGQISSDPSSFRHTAYNNGTNTALQAAAFTTLAKGHKYFSIKAPVELSATTMNTAKEFIEKCNVTVLGSIVDSDPCKLHRTGHPTSTHILFKTYKKQPEEVLTYNAQEVINYLKDTGNYYDDGKVIISKIGKKSFTELP